MGVPYYGDFAEDDTVDIPFNTFTSDDPSASSTITNLLNTDIHIHKDGGLAQRNNAAGITVSVDFDGITGNHLVKIDTNDNTVAGFWVAGSEYQVRMEGTTVDGATINAWIGSFSIERAGGVLALLKAGTVSVNTKTITDGIITAAKLGADCITNAKIADNAIAVENIKDAAITAAKIAGDAITEAKIANNAIAGEHLNATACTKIIDDFETQSQADPTGFHVNVKEVNGTAQTANDNGADINILITALVNKMVTTKANGNVEQFNDANGSLGAIATAITSDATTVTRLRMVI